MGRLDVAIAVVVLILEIYAAVSCILTPESRIRHIPKALWIILILVLPLIGSALWLGVGRTPATAAPRRAAPDDDVAFLGHIDPSRSRASLDAQDERIRQLEAELARLETETDGDGEPGRRRG